METAGLAACRPFSPSGLALACASRPSPGGATQSPIVHYVRSGFCPFGRFGLPLRLSLRDAAALSASRRCSRFTRTPGTSASS